MSETDGLTATMLERAAALAGMMSDEQRANLTAAMAVKSAVELLADDTQAEGMREIDSPFNTGCIIGLLFLRAVNVAGGPTPGVIIHSPGIDPEKPDVVAVIYRAAETVAVIAPDTITANPFGAAVRAGILTAFETAAATANKETPASTVG